MPEVHELTHEVRNALVGLAPFHKDSTREYTPSAYLVKSPNKDFEEGGDIPEDDPEKGALTYVLPESFRAVFTIRPLTKGEEIKWNGYIRKAAGPGKIDVTNDVETRMLGRAIVKGWQNVFDAGSDEYLEYDVDEKGLVVHDLWMRIPGTIRFDILMEAVALSGLTKREKTGLG